MKLPLPAAGKEEDKALSPVIIAALHPRSMLLLYIYMVLWLPPVGQSLVYVFLLTLLAVSARQHCVAVSNCAASISENLRRRPGNTPHTSWKVLELVALDRREGGALLLAL